MKSCKSRVKKNQTCYFLPILFLLEFHDDDAIFPAVFVTKAWRQRLKAACGSWQQSGILSHGKMLQMWKGDIHFTGLLQPATDLQKKPAMRTKVPMRLVTQNTGAIKCFQRATTFAVRFCARNFLKLQVSRSMDVCPARWASWRPCMAPQRNALRVNIPNLTLRTRYEAVDSPELLQSVVILVAGTRHFIFGARAQRVELWSCFRNLKDKFPPPWISKS